MNDVSRKMQLALTLGLASSLMIALTCRAANIDPYDPTVHVAGAYFVALKPVRDLRNAPRSGPGAAQVLPLAIPASRAAATRIGAAFATAIDARLGNVHANESTQSFTIVLRDADESALRRVVVADPRVKSVRRVVQLSY